MPVTIKDVARKAGVGVGTVSRVFNRSPLVSDGTQKKVLDAAHDLGYYPDASARRLVKGQTRVIAFVERHSPFQTFADAFMAEVLRGVHLVTQKEGYHVLFEPSLPGETQEERLLSLVRERHTDGIILSGPRYDDDLLMMLFNDGIPIVLQGELPGSGMPSVDVDNYGGAYLATKHLLALGHSQIAMISNAPLIYTAATARQKGFIDALASEGIIPPKEFLKIGHFSPESGAKAAQDLLIMQEIPTAIFIASDTVAIGAIGAFQQAGLSVPEDIAIVGFDDIPWSAYFNPPLSTLRLPAQDLGMKAAEMLIQQLKGEYAVEQHILLSTELVLRKSCGAHIKSPKNTQTLSQNHRHKGGLKRIKQ